jgi:hypothetical protein
MNRKLVLLALMCCAVSAYAVDKQAYKWTDADGVVHFSDAPPPKTAKDVQMIRVSGNDRPRAVDTETADNSEPGANPAQNAAPNGAATNTSAADANAKACADARNNLDLLNTKLPVNVTGPDGKPVPLDDNARQAQIAAANANIAVYCK